MRLTAHSSLRRDVLCVRGIDRFLALRETILKRVFVTGATGFIGSHLVDRLIGEGIRVCCLVRDSSNLRWLEDKDVDMVYGDLLDQNSLESAVTDIDTVFHVAGATRSPTEEGYYQGNVTGTVNLVKAVLSVNPTLNRFVYISSQAASGPSYYGEPVRESDEPHPLTVYGASKLAGEEAVLAFSSQMPVTVIRPPSVYGPRDTGFLDAFRIIQAGIRPIVGWRKRYLSLVYIDDLIDGLMEAAVNEDAVDQTYFLVSDPPFDWQQISEAITGVLKKKVLTIHVPVLLAYIIAAIGEWLTMLRGNIPRLTTQKVRQFSQIYWVCDSTKARRELHFRPKVTLEEGLERTARWYRQEGWLKKSKS